MEVDCISSGISCGTTIFAAEFQDGVVLAADSRTSCNTYVCNKSADKLTRITDYIYCCRSGSASQTQSLSDHVSHNIYSLERKLGKPALVRDVAAQFRNQIYVQRNSTVASIIVAGWDQLAGGQVYSVPVSGFFVREHCAVAGSGSFTIHGYVTAHYRLGMQENECVDFAKQVVRLAIQQDNHSGGVIRIGVVTKKGIKYEVWPLHEDGHLVNATNKILWNLGICDW